MSFDSRSALAWGAALLAFVVGASGCATAKRAVPETAPAANESDHLTAEQRQEAVASFDLIWDTIRKTYWDPQMNGLDWPAVRDSLRPRVESARTLTEARDTMGRLLATLGLSHYAIIPRAAAGALGRDSHDGEGVPGFDVRVTGTRILVVAVDPGSPAEKAGIRPGWELIEAGGQDVRGILQPLRAELADRTLLELTLVRAVRARMRGPVGAETSVLMRDGRDREIRLDLPRVAPRGKRVTFGNLPPLSNWLEARWVQGDVGYIRVASFFDPGEIMPQFGQAIESFHFAPGLVLDLRGNPGGIGAMAMGMAGWLVGQEGRVLGTMTTRSGQMKFAIVPRAETYDGPVAVLIDALSASTAEILAAGLRDIGRARLFGQRTAGAALPSSILELPDGDLFQYAIANYVSERGQELEGRGVTPDVVAAPTREALLAGHDPALDAAVSWILTKP